jgi:hypothetical protein
MIPAHLLHSSIRSHARGTTDLQLSTYFRPSPLSLSLLPFLSHEVVFLRRMQQSALALFTDATAEGSAF